MSVLGVNPSRDKLAKSIILEDDATCISILPLIGLSPNVLLSKLINNKTQEVKDKAWQKYCETGDILESLSPFVWNL